MDTLPEWAQPVSFADGLPTIFFYLAVALAIGILIGSERERNTPDSTAPGVRTFAILSLTGAVSVLINPYLILVAMLTATIIAIAPTLKRRSKHEDPPPGYGATTLAAATITPTLGALAMYDITISAAIAVAIAIILVSKDRIHQFIRQTITPEELTDALKFFVIALIILPLLPDRTFDPYEVLNPRKIGLLVTALTGIGWAGYIAVRAYGPKKGLPIAGFAGGFVSSTATTAAMARRGKTPETRKYAVAAALLSKISSLLVLAGLIFIINQEVFTLFLLPLTAMIGVILLTVTLLLKNQHYENNNNHTPKQLNLGRPFSLKPALILAVIITFTLVISKIVATFIGPEAVVIISAITGLADTQAPAVAVTALVDAGDLTSTLALISIVLALVTNTILKIFLAYTSGGKEVARLLALSLAPATVILVTVTAAVAFVFSG